MPLAIALIVLVLGSLLPIHFDPHQEASPALITWGPALVYDRLFRFDTNAAGLGAAGGVACALCRSWEMVIAIATRDTMV